MTRFAPIRLLSGLALAALLTSCAGSGAGVDTAADGGAASAAEHSSGPAASTANDSADAGSTDAATSSGTGPGGAGNADGAGNPGGPGGDPAGGGGTDVEAQGNPGAPGDVSVFEEAGVPFSALRDDAAGKCADGVCTLLEPVVGAGNPDDLGTVDDCIIQSQDDISYDPPAQDGFFQRGATVQATVDCTVQDSGTDGTDGTDGTGDTSTTDGDGSDTSVDTGDQQPPADGSQG